jgi:hypothetical protein
MFYGHLDKQPWMEGWNEGPGPTKLVIRGESGGYLLLTFWIELISG